MWLGGVVGEREEIDINLPPSHDRWLFQVGLWIGGGFLCASV